MSKIKYAIMALALVILGAPAGQVMATGNVGVSTTLMDLTTGEDGLLNITATNAVARVDLASSNEGVAKIMSDTVVFPDAINGTTVSVPVAIRGVSAGTATITATVVDGTEYDEYEPITGTYTVTVNVSDPKTVVPNTAPVVNQNTNNTGNANNNINNSGSDSNNGDTSGGEEKKEDEKKGDEGDNEDSANSANSKSGNAKATVTVKGYKLYLKNGTYYLTVPESVTKVEVEVGLEDEHSVIEQGEGVQKLSLGKNTIKVIVKAEDGTRKVYPIEVTRGEEMIVGETENTDGEATGSVLPLLIGGIAGGIAIIAGIVVALIIARKRSEKKAMQDDEEDYSDETSQADRQFGQVSYNDALLGDAGSTAFGFGASDGLDGGDNGAGNGGTEDGGGFGGGLGVIEEVNAATAEAGAVNVAGSFDSMSEFAEPAVAPTGNRAGVSSGVGMATVVETSAYPDNRSQHSNGTPSPFNASRKLDGIS